MIKLEKIMSNVINQKASYKSYLEYKKKHSSGWGERFKRDQYSHIF
jgi:hypothetical protein